MKKITKKTSIGIVGFGNFGRLIADLLSGYFENILVSSRSLNSAKLAKINPKLKLVSLEQAAACEVVIPCVPIGKFESVIKKIAPSLKAGAILADVCSVKVAPARAMKKIVRDGKVHLLNAHPMWGPESVEANGGVKDLKMVLWPLRMPKDLFSEVSRLLKKAGFQVIVLDPKEHDQMAAQSQTLAQFVGKILQKMKAEKNPISTLGHERLLSLLPFVVKNTDELFFDLQGENPFGEKTREQFLKIGEDLERRIIQKSSASEFEALRREIDFCDRKILSCLERRFDCAKKIGRIKKKQGLPVTDKKREAEIIKKRSQETKLEREFLRRFYELVFEESKKRQA